MQSRCKRSIKSFSVAADRSRDTQIFFLGTAYRHNQFHLARAPLACCWGTSPGPCCSHQQPLSPWSMYRLFHSLPLTRVYSHHQEHGMCTWQRQGTGSTVFIFLTFYNFPLIIQVLFSGLAPLNLLDHVWLKEQSVEIQWEDLFN